MTFVHKTYYNRVNTPREVLLWLPSSVLPKSQKISHPMMPQQHAKTISLVNALQMPANDTGAAFHNSVNYYLTMGLP